MSKNGKSKEQVDTANVTSNLANHNDFCGIGEAIVLVPRDQQEELAQALAPTQVLPDDNLEGNQYRLLCGLPAHDERVYPSGISVPVTGRQSAIRSELEAIMAQIESDSQIPHSDVPGGGVMGKGN